MSKDRKMFSSIVCCCCGRVVEVGDNVKYKMYVDYINKSGERRTLLKSPMFVCDNCFKE